MKQFLLDNNKLNPSTHNIIISKATQTMHCIRELLQIYQYVYHIFDPPGPGGI